MLKRKQLINLAKTRLKEARVLFDQECYDGAYYLAGYAVECGLKACVARLTQRHDFPDKKTVDASYVHDLVQLVTVAKLKAALDAEKTTDAQFTLNWTVAKDWTENSRYQRNYKKAAKDLLEAIDEPNHGVLQWISRNW
jgi:HEPN domain-containing protein